MEMDSQRVRNKNIIMKIICSYCKTVIKDDKIDSINISQGICHKCLKEQMKIIQERKHASNL